MPPAPDPQAESSFFPRVPALIFPHWREVLNQSGIPGNCAAGYAMAISGYLDYCRRNGVSVSQASARAFMEEAVRRSLARNPELWKAAPPAGPAQAPPAHPAGAPPPVRAGRPQNPVRRPPPRPRKVIQTQNETALKLAISIDRNTRALSDCSFELRRFQAAA